MTTFNPLFSRRTLLQAGALLGLAMAAPSLVFAAAYEDFFKAATVDNAGEVKTFLARGFDPNTVEPTRGDTALMIAVREGYQDVFDVMLGARNIDLNVRARNGDTALMIAAFKGSVDMVRALLAKGAAVNQPGWTALHYAAASNNGEIVDLLLKKSAAVDAAAPNGTTPLMMASRAGNILIVKRLLDAGADIARKNEQGMNALDMARANNHPDIVEGLTYRMKKAGKL